MRRFAGLGLVACMATTAAPARAAEQLRVGSKRFPESYVLAEIACAAAGATGAEVLHRQGLGGTAIVAQALEQGAIDVYPEYTGTIAQVVLALEGRPGLSELRALLMARGLGMSDPLGFENTYAVAVRRDADSTRAVTQLSDLASRPQLRVALSHEFIGRQDGWPGLASAYGLPQTPRALDHALGYPALASGAVDAIEVYSTDGELARRDLRLLSDDRAFFSKYEAVWVYRLAAAAQAPRAMAALLGVAGTIDTRSMIALNGAMEVDGRSPPEVAASFLSARAPVRPTLRRRASWLRGMLEIVRTEGPRHLGLVAASLALAGLVGVPLGALAERRPRLAAVVLGLTGIAQTIPSLALLCFFLPILGVGVASVLIALFVYALLPIVRGTITGIASIAPGLREAAVVLGLTQRQQTLHVELPLASPAILAGIRTSAVIGVGTATLAAFVGVGGLGAAISTGLALDDTGIILQGAIPAAALALLVDGAFAGLARWVVPRGLRVEAAVRLTR